ncbi:hemicentin-1-like isoform X2 [Lycorma delicatula]|uniref:hemicentin-1-like isoform X2 n=1 Tax=Lycorma delicatula TaxID=130591 RepID=UPI003F515930
MIRDTMFLYRFYLLILIYDRASVSQSVNNTQFKLSEQLNNRTVLSDVNSISPPTDDSDNTTLNSIYNESYLLNNLKSTFNDLSNNNTTLFLSNDTNLTFLNSKFPQNNYEKVWENLIKYGKQNNTVMSYDNSTFAIRNYNSTNYTEDFISNDQEDNATESYLKQNDQFLYESYILEQNDEPVEFVESTDASFVNKEIFEKLTSYEAAASDSNNLSLIDINYEEKNITSTDISESSTTEVTPVFNNFSESDHSVIYEENDTPFYTDTTGISLINSKENFSLVTTPSTVEENYNKTALKSNNNLTISSTILPNSINAIDLPVSDLLNDEPDVGVDSEEEKGVSLAFVFDATGSMWDDLVQVREGAAKILSAMLERPDKPIYDYVLVPFRDPDIGPVTVTKDHEHLMQMLSAIDVYGGGDCPEMSVAAVRQALEVSRPNSYIYVFTDASAKDHNLINEVLPLIQEKLSKVVFVMTGDCGDPNHVAYSVYQKIASTSSGQVYHLQKADVNEVLNFIRLSLPHTPQKVNLLSVDHVGDAAKKKSRHNLSLPIDKTLSEFTVSVSGKKATLGVVDPDGAPAVPPKVTSLLNLENVKVVSIKEPDPGLWTLKVGSDSQYTVRSTGLSSSDFGYGFSLQPTKNKQETSLRPLKGAPSCLLIWATEPKELDKFKKVELIGLNGKVYDTLSLEPVEGEAGMYRTKSFLPPDEFFYLTVHGVSTDGHDFKRITPTAVTSVKPERAGVIASSPVQGHVNEPVKLTCYVKSLLPFDVRWFKDGIKIGKPHHYLQTAYVNLDLPSVSKRDEGLYVCKINNSAGFSYRQIKLTVKVDPPQVNTQDLVLATPGSGVKIDCIVESVIPYNISWKKSSNDGYSKVDLTSWVQNGIMQLFPNNSLYIHQVTIKDEGLYACVAQSDAGIGRGQWTKLVVQEKPDVIVRPNRIELHKGGSFTFNCLVLRGTPTPSLTWEKDGIPIDNYNRFVKEPVNSTLLRLELINIGSEADEGTYTCVAKNKAGVDLKSIKVVFIKQPVVEVENQKWIVVNGTTSGWLHCYVRVVPTFNLTWVKGVSESVYPDTWEELKNNALNDPNKFRIHSNGSLEIFNLKPTDEGWYTCCADYKGSTGTNAVYLTVKELPSVVVKPDKLTFLKDDNEISIQCLLTAGSPTPTVNWFKNGYTLTVCIKSYGNGTKIYYKNNNNNTFTITIKQPQEEDAGDYECRAVNNLGLGSSHTKVYYSEIPTVETNEKRKLVKAGDDVIISCNVRGKPHPTVHWYKDNQKIIPDTDAQFKILPNNHLQISSVEKVSAGVYTCHAENKFGSGADSTVLDVGGPPVINHLPNNTNVEIEQNGSLQCHTTGNPPPKIKWSRKDSQLLDERFVEMENGVLLIKDAKLEDGGIYVCSVENIFGTTASEGKITITGLVPPHLLKNSVGNGFEIVRATPGDDVLLNCNFSVEGKPKSQREWYFNGNHIEINGLSYFYIYENGTLLIKSVNNDYAGNYECVASNAAGYDNKLIKVETFTRPEILPGPSKVDGIVDKSIELECKTAGNPTPTVSWFRFGRPNPLPSSQITSTGSYVIKNVTIQDEGSYICKAENVAGSATWATSLNIIVPPKIISLPAEFYIMENQIIEIYCEVSGKPLPTVKWFRNNESVGDIVGVDSVLRFTASKSDEGIYTCVAYNDGGSDSKNSSVTVLVPPKINNGDEENIQVAEGNEISLNCDAIGYPPPIISWSWKEPENISEINEDEHFSTEGNDLVLKNASLNLAGVYVCHAESSAGIVEKVFNVEVLVPPKMWNKSSEVINIPEGDDHALPCNSTGHPTPQLYWKRGNTSLKAGYSTEDLLVMQDNTLVLLSVSFDKSSGIYSCVAFNAAGTVTKNYTVNVLVAPVVMDSSEKRMEIMETATGKLTCPLTSADPPPTIVWLKDDKALDFRANERADDVHFYTVDGGRSLNIVEARPSDSGIYTCVATNPAGSSQAKFNVDVMLPPFFVQEFAETEFIIKQGQPIIFDCLVAGNPNPKVNWRRLERNLPVTEHTAPGVVLIEGKQKLSITSPRYHHSGRYQCSAINKLGRLQRIFNLTVIGPPDIDGPAEETIDLLKGDSYNLTCSITGIPQPQYSWIYINSRKVEKLLNKSSNSLSLKSVTIKDNGTYICNATNEAGSQKKVYSVFVSETPSIEGSDFTEEIKVRSSDYLKLTCIVSGTPEPVVTWLRNGLLTNGLITNDTRDTNNNNVYSVSLPALGGKYSCVASNKAGVAEKHFSVKVLVAPRLAKQRAYYSNDNLRPVEGQPLTIKCPVTGNPQPQIFWFLNGIPINGSEVNNDTINYMISEYKHSGNYTCFASNHAGNFTKTFIVDVLVPPKFLNPEDEDLLISINSTVKFNCSASGHPRPQILWLRKFTPLPVNNHSDQIYEINGVSVEDSGDYSCLASNLAGDVEKTFRLQVLEPPAMDEGESVTEVSNLTVKLHRRVAIKCPVSGAPLPNITWYKDGEIVVSNPQKMVEISQDGRQLQIMHAIAEDAGSYKCVAENQLGIKELLFDLSVVIPLEWTEWAEWGPCNKTCGGGEQERKRYCGGNINNTKEMSSPIVILDKSNCLGDYVQHRKCNIAPCQMDDGWTKWSDWSSCSSTCGESTRQRTRECKTERPALDGLPCIGPAIQYEFCQVPACSYWSDWSEWSECSAECGYGTKFRERKCFHPDGSCDGQYREIDACNMHSCPVDGSWSEWGEWRPCSVSCGRGTKQRIRICNQPKFGGKQCDGDNLVISECRMPRCHKDIPKRANIRVKGKLNGERIKNTEISAEVKHIRGKRVVTATTDDLLKKQAGWFPYLTFLMPSVNWNLAEEDGSTNNGYTLTDGNFEQESRFKFATGHELIVDSKGRGVNPVNGSLEVDIEVIGEIPLAQPKSSVYIEPFTEDFVQTDKNKLFAASDSSLDVDGEHVPFSWNKTVMYNTELGTMPYLVERMATDDISAEYNPEDNKVHYSAATSISSPFEENTCPKGFVLDTRYEHCIDVDECNDPKANKCHKTQICENLFGSYKCHCPTGFKAANRGRKCIDINECEQRRDKCSHFCQNTKGSYKCTCPVGMTLGSDKLTCYDTSNNSGGDEYTYSDSLPLDDWGAGGSYNFKPVDSNRVTDYYKELLPNRRNNFPGNSRYLEHEQPLESWACPPGQVKEGNRCVSMLVKIHCNEDICNEHETCLPTYSGHKCIQTRCPLKYSRNTKTNKCIKFCNEGFCENGASEAEEIGFVSLPLEVPSVQRYQDLLELLVDDENSDVVYTITENVSDLPLRIRIENGHGILYSLKYFDVEDIQKVVIVATTYSDDHTTPVFISTSVIFLYDPSAI